MFKETKKLLKVRKEGKKEKNEMKVNERKSSRWKNKNGSNKMSKLIKTKERRKNLKKKWEM